MKNTASYLSIVITLAAVLSFGSGAVRAQSVQDASELQKTIMQAKDDTQLSLYFEQLRDIFFSSDRYADLVDLLRGKEFKKKNLSAFVDYSIGLARYKQLKFLEESQNWNEYFNSGSDYRQELVSALESASKAAPSSEPLAVYSRLLLWQFHRDQMDNFNEKAFDDLLSAVREYGKTASDLRPVKLAADTLTAYEEKAAAKELYTVYLNRMTSADTDDAQLQANADKFLQEGNMELAEAAYDSLLERLAKNYPKEEAVRKIREIALRFTYQDGRPCDPAYALKVFALLEKISADAGLDEEALYLAGYNAERCKDFTLARDYYSRLLERFPQTVHAEELGFKLGAIYAYVKADLEMSRQAFQKVADSQTVNANTISSLYQLGLLAQWQQDYDKAKEYYTILLDKASEGFSGIKELAGQRMEEIEKGELIDNRIRTFLELSLRENNIFTMSKASIAVSAYAPAVAEQLTIQARAVVPQSGCMQVVLEDFWSGDLGSAQPEKTDESFTVSYADKGTKLICLVVASPTGIIDRAIDFIDVR